MSIEVTCVQCGSSHHVNDRLAGRRVRCPNCDTAVHVPEIEVGMGAETEAEEVFEVEPVEVELEAVAEEFEPFAEPLEPVMATAGAVAAVAPVATVSDGATGVADSGVPSSVEDEEEDDEVLPRQARPEEEMDMTPMVDVTFLLLIFFMVTAAFSLQKSIEMPRQQTDAPSTSTTDEEPEELDLVEVQVDEFGSFLVMTPDFEEETPGKQNLLRALKQAIEGNTSGMKLVIKVHELAKLHSLVDAMDAGTIAGYAELEVTQVEEFD